MDRARKLLLARTSQALYSPTPPRSKSEPDTADDLACMCGNDSTALISLSRLRHMTRLGYKSSSVLAFAAAALCAEYGGQLSCSPCIACVEVPVGNATLRFMLTCDPDLRFSAELSRPGFSCPRYATGKMFTPPNLDAVLRLARADSEFFDTVANASPRTGSRG